VTLAFAREGARLVLAGRDTAAIEPVAAEARALGVEAIVVPCDLTVGAQTEALAAHALEAFGRIDVLVNVAGGSGPIGKTGWETTPRNSTRSSAQHDRLLQHHARRAADHDRSR
jgi:NAD(P)-dependent dehydrogenase (short-subunit alcohol dehydrogenase family)